MKAGYFDTEDDTPELLAAGRSGFDKRMTRICAVDHQGKWFLNHGERQPFLSWLQRRPPMRWYAHNCKYDLGNLFGDELDGLHWSMLGTRLIKAQWRGHSFMDSFNIWPMKLKKIGEAFGLDKLAMDIHSAKYVRRDVEILRRAMRFAEKFVAGYGVELLPATLGRLTVQIWQHLGGENWHCALALARAALYGGRVELFCQGGRGRALYTDINSLYPWCMTQPFPVAALPWAGLPESQARHLTGWGAAYVTLDIPRCRFGPLPVRREDDSIYYPWGRVTGVWTLHEIRAALGQGARLVKFGDARREGWLEGVPMIGSQRAAYYYRDYIQTIYRLRQAASQRHPDGAEAVFLKFLLNNLYGQLGLKGSLETTIELSHALDEDGAINREGVAFGSKFLTEIEFPLPAWTNYLHAAYITSYARLRLAEFLRRVPAADLVYCDTDSMIFWRKSGAAPFSCGLELGEMKLVTEMRRCQAVAPKVYRYESREGKKESRAKGIPHRLGADGRMLPDVFIDDGIVHFDQPFGLKESIVYFDEYRRNGKRSPHARKLSVWREVEKRRMTQYDKKILKQGYYYAKKHQTG